MFKVTNALGWTESFTGSVIQSLVAYDNCDLKFGVSQQSDTKKNTLFSITSAIPSPAVGLWRSLTQSDFKRMKLELDRFVRPERNSVMKQFTEALICEALAEVDPKSINHLMIKKLAAFPVIDQLSVPPPLSPYAHYDQ
ncbi:hypothetical protein V8E54_001120 [Elaphomyces granulatus]